MRRRTVCFAAAVLLVGAMASGCGGDAATAVPFTVEISPEFVQGLVPGETTGVLVTITNEQPTDEPVEVTAAAEGAEITVEPASIRTGEVAEVMIVAEPASEERAVEIVVTGRRGDIEATASRSTVVRPWDDGDQAYAEELLGLFTTWLAEHEPDLGIGPETAFAGSFVSPVLVVTHHMFLSEDWEIGLSRHVMVPPDDWAEVYLRPRDELAPTHAFRLQSQDGALLDGVVEITAVAPPPEVVR